MSNLIENMIQSGELSAAARDMRPTDALLQWAEANAVEYVNVEFTDGTTLRDAAIAFRVDGTVTVRPAIARRGE